MPTPSTLEMWINQLTLRLNTHTLSSTAHVTSGSVVGTTMTQDLSNKTLATCSLKDDTVCFVDATDTTKKMRFECSGITASNTRVMTVPNTDLTLVGTSITQDISGKTFTDTTQFSQYLRVMGGEASYCPSFAVKYYTGTWAKSNQTAVITHGISGGKARIKSVVGKLQQNSSGTGADWGTIPGGVISTKYHVRATWDDTNITLTIYFEFGNTTMPEANDYVIYAFFEGA